MACSSVTFGYYPIFDRWIREWVLWWWHPICYNFQAVCHWLSQQTGGHSHFTVCRTYICISLWWLISQQGTRSLLFDCKWGGFGIFARGGAKIIGSNKILFIYLFFRGNIILGWETKYRIIRKKGPRLLSGGGGDNHLQTHKAIQVQVQFIDFSIQT